MIKRESDKEKAKLRNAVKPMKYCCKGKSMILLEIFI